MGALRIAPIPVIPSSTSQESDLAMDASEPMTTITSEKTILRLLSAVSEQNVPIFISPASNEVGLVFSSKIAKIDQENQQLVIHQLTNEKHSDELQKDTEIEVSCHMQHGTLKFKGRVSPLEQSANSIYSSLPIPRELSKKQLRGSYRVSLLKYDTDLQFEVDENTTNSGTCRDISLFGALIQLSDENSHLIESGAEHSCRIIIPEHLDLSCMARVCHVKQTEAHNLLIGLNFLNLDPPQLNNIKSALANLQRQSITKKTS